MIPHNLWNFILQLGIAAAGVYLLYRVLFAPGGDFVIRVRDGDVRFKGRIATTHQPALAHFLVHELALRRPVRIVGIRRGQRLELRFRGRLSEADKQRIRNYLATTL
jgi:hypothetical protein